MESGILERTKRRLRRKHQFTYRLGVIIMKLEQCLNILSRFLEQREKDRERRPLKQICIAFVLIPRTMHEFMYLFMYCIYFRIIFVSAKQTVYKIKKKVIR